MNDLGLRPPRRSDVTRDEIKSAFTSLVFAGGFEAVTVQKVVREASVARSTFYEHFGNKEDVLRACMEQFFSVVADCVQCPDEPELLYKVLDHLWQNRRLADAIFIGQARIVLARQQADLVEIRLRTLAGDRDLALPSRLAAIQIAEA
ncbi:MAG: TetR/AcrR family transcriptional regulator, partial [Sphingomicrobium sp.]